VAAGTLSPRQLAALVPDEPRWIDLRGTLLTGRCQVWAERAPADGFIVGSRDFPFASLWGRPRPELIAAATSAGRSACTAQPATEEWQLLAPPERRSLVEATLPGWRRRGITLHRWRGNLDLDALGDNPQIRVLPDGHHGSDISFDHFPEESRNELALEWVSTRPIALALTASRPVSYCWAAFTTETLWDVAIETAEPYRRHGLAARCFLTLAAHMARQGKTPAWGAMDDNSASLGLAARLGFVPDAKLDGWSPSM
jgi:GNAT superfamily N-acetyltransferase